MDQSDHASSAVELDDVARNSNPNVQSYEIDARGDLKVEVSGTEFLVSRKVLILSTEYFDKMLNSNFAEGSSFDSDKCPTISLKEDDPWTMQLLLSIIHYRLEKIPKDITTKQLLDISIHSDKYRWTETLGPWFVKWFDEQYQQSSSEFQLKELIYASGISKDGGSFAKFTLKACKSVSSRDVAQWDHLDMFEEMTVAISDEISTQIRRTLKELQISLESAERELQQDTKIHNTDIQVCPGCGRDDLSPEAKTCHRCRRQDLLQKYCTVDVRIADYFRALRTSELWPFSTFDELSVQDIVERVNHLGILTRHKCSRAAACSLISVIESLKLRASRIDQQMTGLSLSLLLQ